MHHLKKYLFTGLIASGIITLYYCYISRAFGAPSECLCLSKFCHDDDCKITSSFTTFTADRESNMKPSNTMARLGTDLHFDLHKCPPDSYMLVKKSDSFPKHHDCPTLFIVGARKGGTTSLYQYVSKHPDFKGIKLNAGPRTGETFFFAEYYTRKPWEEYISQFPSGDVMSGESSVANLVHNLVPRILYESCGKKAKIVMLFRDPVKRLESNFLMRVRLHENVREGTSISTIVEKSLDNFLRKISTMMINQQNLPEKWSDLVGEFKPARSFIFEGLYYVHLLNWLCNFPAENILILNSEEFFQHPGKILDIVVQFLGLRKLDSETYKKITSASYNTGNYKIPDNQRLSQTDITSLLEVFRPYNDELFALLKWNTTQWL